MLKSITVLLLALFVAVLPQAIAQQDTTAQPADILGIPERIGANIYRGPSIQALEKKARKSFDAGNYYLSMQYYQRILDIDAVNLAALEGLGTAALAHTKYYEAVKAYTLIRDSNLLAEDGLALLRLAEARYHMKHYAEAKGLYEQAGSKAQSSELKAEAQTGIKNCEWAIAVQNNMADISLDSLQEYVNTNYSEYSNIWSEGQLYYSSYSLPFKGDSSRLLIHTMAAQPRSDGSLSVGPTNFNVKNRHTAYVTFNTDKSVMYYAVGKYAGNKKIRFNLYSRKRVGDSSWGDPKKLPKSINLRGTTATQPHICQLPGDNAETLFFVSDRPGGKGKKDIWYSRIVNDTFSAPVNLSALNTSGDDVTPYFHPGTGTLFFSSTGRQGLGGFDIYRSDYVDQTWGEIAHMPAPLNSNANDVFYSLSANGNLTFFSSNRYGSKNFSEEECCYDIFKHNKPPGATITACNQETNDTLHLTTMTLVEITPNGPKELSKVRVPGATHTFPLLPGKDYMIITEKIGFVADTFHINSPKKVWDEEIAERRCLKPARVDLIVTVLDGDTLRPIPGATVVLKTTARMLADGTMETGPDGQPLAFVTRDDKDSSEYRFDLLFQHEYKVSASKEGYTSDSSEVSTIGLKGTTTLHRELFLRRGLNLDVFVFDDIKKDPLNDVIITLKEIRTPRIWIHPTGPNNNDYHTIIHYDTRYRVLATKEGYSKDSLDFGTDGLPRIPFQRLRRELFLRPLDIQEYLPIALYFDNDEPGPHSRWVDTVDVEYIDTYLPYYNRKKRFLSEYTEGLVGDTLETARFRMDTFFERRVRGEWNRMRMFSEVLYELLLNGDRVRIEIRGYASPLASGPYNKALTSRRVASIINHFSIFDGEIFMPFIESKQLVLIRVPNGDSKAPGGISDSPKNRRLSVYSIDASTERRVEIVGVDVNGEEIPIPIPQK